jgi:hypothetical protein
MIEVLKAVIATMLGGAISYGYMKAEINQIKAAIQQHQSHAERLAAIEAKIDILLNQKNR